MGFSFQQKFFGFGFFGSFQGGGCDQNLIALLESKKGVESRGWCGLDLGRGCDGQFFSSGCFQRFFIVFVRREKGFKIVVVFLVRRQVRDRNRYLGVVVLVFFRGFGGVGNKQRLDFFQCRGDGESVVVNMW